MRIIGLTGGIGSGKSTVHRVLEALGADVLDADAIYHELIAPAAGRPSELARALGERFPGVVATDGTLDRRVLGARVFGDAGELAALDAIAHPAVARETARRMSALADRGARFVVYDVPLLYEAQLATGMDGVIVVWAPREVQLSRLMARDGLSREDALARVASQMPLDEKRARATWVIDSSGTMAATRAQVERLWRELQHLPRE